MLDKTNTKELLDRLFTWDSFIAFLATKSPDETYVSTAGNVCALAQWAKSIDPNSYFHCRGARDGFNYYIMGQDYDLRKFSCAAMTGNFGETLNFARSVGRYFPGFNYHIHGQD